MFPVAIAAWRPRPHLEPLLWRIFSSYILCFQMALIWDSPYLPDLVPDVCGGSQTSGENLVCISSDNSLQGGGPRLPWVLSGAEVWEAAHPVHILPGLLRTFQAPVPGPWLTGIQVESAAKGEGCTELSTLPAILLVRNSDNWENQACGWESG